MLFAFTGAQSLVAWLMDGSRTFLWRAESAPVGVLEFELLASANVGTVLMDRVVDATGLRAASRKLARGGLEYADLTGVARAPRLRLALGPEVGSLLLLPFEIDAENQGVLQLESSRRSAFAGVEQLERTAELLGAAIAARRAQAALTERVKELACMYQIARIGAEADASLAAKLERIVALLPAAWQYPEITTARVSVDERVFASADFAVGPHRLGARIQSGGRSLGAVEVFYVPTRGDPKNAPLLEQSPFLEEELHLIEGVAREIASIVERQEAAEEKARLREQIRKADRLATIGHLAAGLAHELNEPLGNILGFAQLSLKLPDLPEQAATDLDWIVRSSLYAREVIKKLMLFARQAPSQATVVDVNAIIRESIPLLSTRRGGAIVTVESSLTPAALLVRGDRGQLQQVFVNLAVNAIQAMPSGGVLRVSTAATEQGVVLSVEDTGEGIPEGVVDQIFEPFFTTKDVGEGTGLGLSVAHGIVTAHGGTIEVDTAPGRGTTMRVTLPPPSDDHHD